MPTIEGLATMAAGKALTSLYGGGNPSGQADDFQTQANAGTRDRSPTTAAPTTPKSGGNLLKGALL